MASCMNFSFRCEIEIKRSPQTRWLLHEILWGCLKKWSLFPPVDWRIKPLRRDNGTGLLVYMHACTCAFTSKATFVHTACRSDWSDLTIGFFFSVSHHGDISPTSGERDRCVRTRPWTSSQCFARCTGSGGFGLGLLSRRWVLSSQTSCSSCDFCLWDVHHILLPILASVCISRIDIVKLFSNNSNFYNHASYVALQHIRMDALLGTQFSTRLEIVRWLWPFST